MKFCKSRLEEYFNLNLKFIIAKFQFITVALTNYEIGQTTVPLGRFQSHSAKIGYCHYPRKRAGAAEQTNSQHALRIPCSEACVPLATL